MQIFSNNSKSTLGSAIGPSDLLIPVIDATSFPTFTALDGAGNPNYALVTIEIAGTTEVIKLMHPGKTGTNLIIDPAGRGWDGTTPLSFISGARVEGRITAGTLNTIVTNAKTYTDTETTRAEVAETALQVNITAEALIRSGAVTAEQGTRITNDNTLQTHINTEAGTRSTADNTLQTNINNEATTRGTAITGLQNNISSEIASVVFFAMSTPPTIASPGTGGWLECNGASFVTTGIYANLYAKIGITYGGTVNVSFQVPDLRGEFIRGWDDGRGVDTGRTFGSWQVDAFKSHTHTYTVSYTTAPQSGNSTPCQYQQHTSSTGATGDVETRPRNVALLPCIRY